MRRRIEKTIVLKLKPLGKGDEKMFYTLLEAYNSMLMEATRIVVLEDIRSRKKAHKRIYPILRERWPEIHNKFAQEAYKRALAMYRSYRQRLKKYKAGKLKHKPSPPDPKAKNVLDIHIDTFRIIDRGEYKLLRLSYGGGRYIWFLMVEYEWANRHLADGWEVKNSKILVRGGEIYLHLSVAKEVEVEEHGNKLLIDINEGSVDCMLYLPKQDKTFFFWIEHDVREIRLRYREMRKRVQKNIRNSDRTKILAKYGARERARVEDRIKKITTLLARIAKHFNADIVREDLVIERDKKTRNKQLNYRLSTFSHRKVIRNLDYKALEKGLEVISVDPRNTSRTCPNCGYTSSKNRRGDFFKCINCGFQARSHYVACINLLLRLDDGVGVRMTAEELRSILRWVPPVVGTTAPNEALIRINEVLRGKPESILLKMSEMFSLFKT